MSPRMPKPGKDAYPGATRIMQSQYRNICPCGRSIARGELIYYDRHASQKIRCLPCGKKLAALADQGLSEVAQPPEVQNVIDRIRQLQALNLEQSAESQKEFAHHLWSLRESHSDQTSVRRLFAELANCRRKGIDLFGLRAKYPGTCLHCSEPQKAGSLILYDKDNRKIHCLACEIDCMSLRKHSQ